MKAYYGKQHILPRGKKVSMGIDVHAESWHVTALSAGKERFHGRIPVEYPALGKLLNQLVECQILAAYKSILMPDPISESFSGSSIKGKRPTRRLSTW